MTISRLPALFLALLVAACAAQQTVGPRQATVAVTDHAALRGQSFVAELARVEEFLATPAWGQATFRLDPKGRVLNYALRVDNLYSATTSHMHLAPDALGPAGRGRQSQPDDAHGPVVVTLLDFVPGGVSRDGVLATGTIGPNDLMGPLRGRPLDELIELIEQGQAYVTVHFLQRTARNSVFCCPDGLRGVVRPAQPL
jgi:hypothetical protein